MNLMLTTISASVFFAVCWGFVFSRTRFPANLGDLFNKHGFKNLAKVFWYIFNTLTMTGETVYWSDTNGPDWKS